ncbi:hypothetical protein BDZ45DRAFT_672015 [Acephala macrosclerotiorum]|nr:hypothetical protein BDZ45DRAFT_672015 [Acephala macrosclerotiorum]
MAQQDPTDVPDEQGNAAPWLNGRPFSWEELGEIDFFSRKLRMDNEACRAAFEESSTRTSLLLKKSSKETKLSLKLCRKHESRTWCLAPLDEFGYSYLSSSLKLIRGI